MNSEYKALEKLADLRDYKIALANEVIDTMRCGLSAKQQKTLDYMLMRIQPDDTVDKSYSFSIQEYCAVFNIDYRKSSTNYKDIEDAVQSLDSKGKWINFDTNEKVLVKWFRNVKLNQSRGIISYNIDDTIAPHIFGLIKAGNYTTHDIRQTGAFESKYSRPMYLLLKRHLDVDIKEPFISIDKLRILLAAEKYSRYADFKRFVLDMTKHEINKYTYMRMSYEPHKAIGSRAITHIAFKVEYVKGEEKRERENNTINAFGEQGLYDELFLPME